MPTLHVYGVSDELYQQLQTLAQARGRSLSAQVVALLEEALEMEVRHSQQRALLDAVHQRRFKPPSDGLDSLAFLRQDRER